MEQKENNFCAFQKKAKTGRNYYRGEVRINGVLYWVSIFEKTTKSGDSFLSGVLEEKKEKETPVAKQEKQVDDWINDPIPF